jgi:1,4-alpha-glucan branching enzyme
MNKAQTRREVKKMAKKTGAGKSKTARRVQFEFLAPEAREVFLAGDFNRWDIGAHPMKKDKNGRWKVALDLEPGRYEYRFFANGKWENDPACSSCIPNQFGSCNCVRLVR